MRSSRFHTKVTPFGAFFFIFVTLFVLPGFILPGMAEAQQDITVDLSSEYQTMDGTGGNAYGFITGSNWSPKVLDMIINDLTVSHIRFRSAINQWEPSNDNSDPFSINWSGFNDSKAVHDDFVLLQKLSTAGIECILGIWEVPDWMVLNPGAGQNRIIPPKLYTEFAELIVSYILYAKSNYGANITCLSIQNEPNIGIYNYFSADEMANVTEVVLNHLDVFGLGYIKLHVGDVNEPASAIAYFEASMDRQTIAPRTQAVSYHTWHNMTEPILANIRDFAKEYGVSSWATEVGSNPLDSKTFDWALGSMKNHHFAYKYAHSSMSFQWCLGGAETSIEKDGTPNPIYHALKHYHHHIRPGSVRVGAYGDTGSLFTTAFIDKNEKRLSIITTDWDSYTQNVTYKLNASNCGYHALDVYKTTSALHYAYMGTVALGPDGSFTYPVEARSFHTFSCRYNNLPQLSFQVMDSLSGPGLVDYVFTLTDPDGIVKDMAVAGIAFYKGGVEIITLYYNDPNPPDSFQVSIDPTGRILTMKALGFPKYIGLTLIGGGVDVDGALAVKVVGI